ARKPKTTRSRRSLTGSAPHADTSGKTRGWKVRVNRISDCKFVLSPLRGWGRVGFLTRGLRRGLHSLAASRLLSEPHDVVAAVDVDGFSGDAGAGVGSQKHAGVSNFFDLHITAEGRAFRMSLQHVTQTGDTAGGESLDRARRDGVDPNFLRSKVAGEIADGALQSGFGDGHHVVMRDNFLRAKVGHGHDASAVGHERRGGAGDRNQGIDAYVHRDAKAFARSIDELAL